MVLNTISYKFPRDDPNALIHKAHHSSFHTKVDDDNHSKPQNKVWIIDEKTGLLFASVTEWIDFIESAFKKEYISPKPAPRVKSISKTHSNSNQHLTKLNMLNYQMKIFKPLLGNHF